MDENHDQATLNQNSAGLNVELSDSFRLARHDFTAGTERLHTGAHHIPMPDEIPALLNRADLPDDLKRSITIEAVLNQNEDLMARLRVTLRRLNEVEKELSRVQIENRSLAEVNKAIANRTSVYQERELSWQQERRAYEQGWEVERQKLTSRVADLAEECKQIPGLQERLERFKRYQERIKTHVKPYVQQLKNYAEQLNSEAQDLVLLLSEREHQIQELTRQRHDLQNKLEVFQQDQLRTNAELMQQSESDRSLFIEEISRLKDQNAKLEVLAKQVDRVRAREHELENIIIAVQRDKENLTNLSAATERSAREELSQARGKINHLDYQLGETKRHANMMIEEQTRLQNQNAQLQEQLTSLRLIWGTQSEELQKQKQALAAFEKINAELSRQLLAQRQAKSDLDQIRS